MKKLLIWILILIALTSFASAETCYTNEPCGFATVVYNTTTNYFDATNVNNSMVNTNGSVIYSNQPMLELSTGRFVYNYTFNSAGTYLRESVVNGIYIMNEDVRVTPNVGIANIGISAFNSTWLIIIVFLILAMGILLLFKKKSG